jgi:hypothetical protein
MLNPSAADAEHDDPTIRRCIGFARRWGYGALDVVNLFAFRTHSPALLKRAADPVGPENDRHLAETVARASRVVAAWGCHGGFDGRNTKVLPLLGNSSVCFGLTRGGHPRHPLYVRGDADVERLVVPPPRPSSLTSPLRGREEGEALQERLCSGKPPAPEADTVPGTLLPVSGANGEGRRDGEVGQVTSCA